MPSKSPRDSVTDNEVVTEETEARSSSHGKGTARKPPQQFLSIVAQYYVEMGLNYCKVKLVKAAR